MKVILFHPRGRAWAPKGRDIHAVACVMAPIGIASIGAVVRNAGHEVVMMDGALDFYCSNQEWAQRIYKEKPDFVGFSATTLGFLDAYDVCSKVKQLESSIKTVFGGVHVSWGKNKIIEDYPLIDYVIDGEGEYAFRDLLATQGKTPVPSVYSQSFPTFSTQTSYLQCEMDDLPFPAYDLVAGFPKRYQMPLFGYPKHPGAVIISSRGCVYRCTYCDRSVFHKSFRFNSPEYTFEQMKWLSKDFGVRHINFYDDLFTLNRERVAKLCALITEQKINMSFNCIVRVGHIDNELLKMLKKAGCWMVHVGIESGDQKLLDIHKAGVTIEQIKNDVTRVAAAGLWVKGLFMIGIPGENEESMIRTRKFAMTLPLKDANITAFTPFPGAPISQTIHELGTLDNDWSKMDCENVVFVSHEAQSKEVIERNRNAFIKEFYERKYMRRIYRTMMVQSPHSYWRLIKHAGSFLRYARSM